MDYLIIKNSCADTMVTTAEDDAALHSCADTLAESDDEIDFGDSPTPPIGSGEMKFWFIFWSHEIIFILKRERIDKIFFLHSIFCEALLRFLIIMPFRNGLTFPYFFKYFCMCV